MGIDNGSNQGSSGHPLMNNQTLDGEICSNGNPAGIGINIRNQRQSKKYMVSNTNAKLKSDVRTTSHSPY
jgi:hypothetical protein